MGKSLPITEKLQSLAKNTIIPNLKTPKQVKPISRNSILLHKSKNMESITSTSSSSTSNHNNSEIVRLPLSEVVSDCVKRWFKDTLKEAKAGDINMQVLVGQMYFSGYGVVRDAQKGRTWMTRASRVRSSVWKVSDKRPGYNASDSDSDELKVDS